MDYYLHREGRNEGVFPLEELRRRRQIGELNGSEHVWCEGMADWQLLDSVLGTSAPAYRAPSPPPLAGPSPCQPRSHGVKWWVIAAIAVFVVLVIAGVIVGLWFRTKLLPAVNQAITQAVTPTAQTAIDAASAPVTWTTNTQTEADVQKRHREFRVRQWLEGYQERGDRTEPCDGDAVDYLKAWISRTYGGDADANPLSISEWSDNLANNPTCTDPLILTMTGVNSIELHEKERRLQRAMNAYPNSKHLAYPKFYAAVSLADTMRELSPQDRRVAPVEQEALTELALAFSDGSFQPGDQAEVADILMNGWGYNFFYEYRSSVCDIVKKSGKSFEWLSLMLDGEFRVDEAWKARGGGYVDTVTPQGWQGFSTNLEIARASFTQAWKLRPDLPLAADRMIYVSLGQTGIGEMRMWFDRAVAAQIDDPAAWSNMRWGLRPRWYGDLNSMRALGVTAVNTRRFDTDVPRKFFDVVSDMESELELEPGNHIYGRDDIWPVMQQMYEGYIAEPSQQGKQQGWQSTYAVVAYLAGKYDVARTQLEAINWKPWPDNLTAWDADLSLMPGEVAARTGPSAGKVADAENARNGRLYDLALRLYTELADATDTDMRTRDFARFRCAGLKMEQQLDQGGWVNFLPQSDDDLNWVYSWDETHRIKDGALEIKSGPGGHLCYSRVRVGTDFEVQGEFEVAGSSSKDFQAGLVMGMPDCNASFNSYNWYAFRMKQNATEGDVASFAQGWTVRQVVKMVALNSDHNTFRFRLHDGECSAFVNDTEVFSDVKAPAKIRVPDGQFLLGLGAFNDNNDTVIRYRNVQVREIK